MEKKSKKWVLSMLIVVAAMLMLCACKKGSSAEMANELEFSLEDISELTISYDDEDIRFFVSQDENLIIREYMSKNKKSYHAKVRQSRDSIQISEGGKPFFKGGFMRYVEVYLPESYSETLKVTTTDGTIDMSELELELASMRVDCTSGTFKLGSVRAQEIYFSSTSGKCELGEIAADQIRLETTKGEVTCGKIEGKVDYTSTSGNGEFLSARGSGDYRAENSGKLSVNYEEVTGDLSFYNKNDGIDITLPEDLDFVFEAVTKNGRVDTDFQGDVSVDGNTTSGTVGKAPAVTIRLETKNGNIEVNR